MASDTTIEEELVVDPYLESTQRHFWLFTKSELGTYSKPTFAHSSMRDIARDSARAVWVC